MRTIDADALKELFSEVIGSIAKKPEMNGNLEHMIRASAMVIQMIDDAPTVQPDTNCSEFPNNWIPCSERLPKEGKVVLTQAKFKDDVKMAVSSRIDYNYWTGWGTRDINIIAWMPLPEPYREGGAE